MATDGAPLKRSSFGEPTVHFAVANAEKFMPRDFISEDGYGITDKCRRYLLPLIQGEDYPAYSNGLPVYVTLANHAVPKKLPAFEKA